MQKRCMYTSMQKHHFNTHTHTLLWGIVHSRPVLMRLVVRINACQVGALAQYRRGQTVTESSEKIIILIMMPWRPPFIYQSTSPPPSVTLSPDPPCSLHLASNLIDFLHKHLIFSPLCDSLFFCSILLFVILILGGKISPALPLIPFSFPLTVSQELAF